MSTITYEGKTYQSLEGLSVLESLEQQGVNMVSSCRKGTCQSCKKKITTGSVPSSSQNGLKPTEQALGYFLPCVCYPQENISMVDIDQNNKYPSAVANVELLNNEIAKIELERDSAFQYFSGQYIQVYLNDTLFRHYSLASSPERDDHLILHVKKVDNGQVSPLLHEIKTGTKLTIAGPIGECFYHEAHHDKPILLIGTGSGLAPLYGILKDALAKEHKQPIWLFHGVGKYSQLYLEQELKELAEKHVNFLYFPCLSEEAHVNCESGMVGEIALKKVTDLKNTIIYLAGAPQMVTKTSMDAFLSGASIKNIYKDPFN